MLLGAFSDFENLFGTDCYNSSFVFEFVSRTFLVPFIFYRNLDARFSHGEDCKQGDYAFNPFPVWWNWNDGGHWSQCTHWSWLRFEQLFERLRQRGGWCFISIYLYFFLDLYLYLFDRLRQREGWWFTEKGLQAGGSWLTHLLMAGAGELWSPITTNLVLDLDD